MSMSDHVCNRRFLTRSLTLAPFLAIFRRTSSSAQSLITQPEEKTKAGYLARAGALRDQAAREGDQAYGAVVVRRGIVGEGRNYVVLESVPGDIQKQFSPCDR